MVGTKKKHSDLGQSLFPKTIHKPFSSSEFIYFFPFEQIMFRVNIL